MPKNNDTGQYKKLGGWLLCIVGLYFVQVAYIAFQFFGESGAMDVLRRWEMYIGAQGILLLAGQAAAMVQVVIYLFAAIGILQRDPGFLRTRQMAFVTTAVGILLQLVYGILYGFVQSGGPLFAIQAVALALNILAAMLYFSRSARVRAYMGSDEFLRMALFTRFFTKKANNNTDGGDL